MSYYHPQQETIRAGETHAFDFQFPKPILAIERMNVVALPVTTWKGAKVLRQYRRPPRVVIESVENTSERPGETGFAASRFRVRVRNYARHGYANVVVVLVVQYFGDEP